MMPPEFKETTAVETAGPEETAGAARPGTAEPGTAEPGTARAEEAAGAKDTGGKDTAEPEETTGAQETTGTQDAAGTGPTERRSLRLPAALAAAAIVLGGFGVWATVQAHSLRSASDGQNTALTDRAATAAVTRQVSSAVNTIFSYDYTNTARTRQAAQGLLTGDAIKQYNRLFALVERDAPKEKLVVKTTVSSSGVEFLTGDRARLLIFADQQDTIAGTRKSTYAGTMFAVTAVRQDGRWKIESIDTFTGG